jgi:membrane-bound serine protease (ClpP class)
MTTLIISLIVVALLLFFLEIFAPGGVLGFMGACSLIAAAVLAYDTMGILGSMSIVGGGIMAGFVLFFVEINVLTKTKFGKRIQHHDQQTAQTVPVGRPELVGKTGQALTTMAPTGKVRISNETFEAAANSGLINKNATIEVVRSEHLKLIVKEI